MANPAYSNAGKWTTAVFVKTRRDGKDVYYREQYNIVTYNTDRDSNAVSYMEGVAQDGVGTPYSAQEMYNDILICEAPPWPGCRIGQQPAQ